MMESKICIKCKKPIHPMRLKALPGTNTCVECSTVGAKSGVPVMFGSKDHTWTDLVIMEEDEFKAFKKIEKKKDKGFDKLDD
tara:strand:- start:624 stop:869 length:246 start_codon:yes stop_codon:yes gene_type:complete